MINAPKRVFLMLFLSMACMGGQWALAQDASLSPSAPSFPHNFVGDANFETTAGPIHAGTAFLARTGSDLQVYLLTVRHLLGPDGGFKRLVPPEEVPTFVHSIRLHEFFGGSQSYGVTGLAIPVTKDKKAPLYDLAIFKVDNVPAGEVPLLTAQSPAIGDVVWVVAHLKNNKGETFSYPAKVTNNGDRWLVADFEDPNLLTKGASGAPVLDATGKVVGIYSGHTKGNGKLTAYIIPAALVLKTINGP